MAGLNKIMVIGNLGADPEMRYTPNGNPVTSFSIATSRSWTSSDGERKEETEWFRVVAWNQLAERANQFLTKGKRAYVEGRLKSNQFEGQDGQVRHTNEIIANQIMFLDPRTEDPANGSATETPSEPEKPQNQESQEDDIPF
tara:strand:+ start:83 stop:508 length:426 start_codon:yes stop_codon:yes gene_type:complete